MTVVSTVLRPVGPEPPSVYWRRRLLVIGALLLVLLLFWLLFLRGGGSGSATPSGSASPTATSSPAASTSPAQTTSTSPSPTATETGVAACKDDAIAVKASTDAATYPAGSDVKMTLTITNTGKVACTRDVGSKANELVITSGGYAVWSSDDCNPGGNSNVVTMKPKDVYASTVTWDGTVTEGKCRTNAPEAKPGSYDLVGRNGEVKSESTRFALT